MKQGFELYFRELKEKKQNVKFVIVLGSGFHKQAFVNRIDVNNSLTSWNCLLKEISPAESLSTNYLLDFERIVLNDTKNQDDKAAYEIEKNY